MMQPVPKPDRLQLSLCSCKRVRAACQLAAATADILERSHSREQVKGLEHDADPAAAGAGERILADAVKSAPAMRIVPPVGCSMPERTAIREDLPEPDGPSNATLSPAATCRSTPRNMSTRAAFGPSDRVTSEASMT
jgi:hypothetical protein